MAAGYVILADAFALTTTPKTACLVIATTTQPVIVVEIGASVDQGTGRCLVELVESTQAGVGTSTATGAKQLRGFAGANIVGPNATYGREYSAEPTVLSVLKSWRFPCPGPFVLQFPLGREARSLVSGATAYKALGIRLSVDTGTPTADAYLEFDE